jgi:hypothetical protein
VRRIQLGVFPGRGVAGVELAEPYEAVVGRKQSVSCSTVSMSAAP